jgi:transcriptional regulator GlxA family with amidase domain
MRWLTLQRLLEARRLLEATDLPVEDIAQRCGLGTSGNLRLHLAREAATTPTAYRRAFRSGPATRPAWGIRAPVRHPHPPAV